MKKFLLIANTVLTLPFGIAALIAPAAVFSGFGIALDPGGELIARGYAATCIGYGIIFFLLRNIPGAQVVKTLSLASFVFNLIETIIQAAAGSTGLASQAIWGNVTAHALMTLPSAWIFLKTPKAP